MPKFVESNIQALKWYNKRFSVVVGTQYLCIHDTVNNTDSKQYFVYII